MDGRMEEYIKLMNGWMDKWRDWLTDGGIGGLVNGWSVLMNEMNGWMD